MQKYLSLVKFSHSIFALPFALVGFTIAIQQGGTFSWWLLVQVLVCMVTARNAAMGFNRWADRKIDAKNARTAVREIPAGIVSSKEAVWFIILNSVGFMAMAYAINPLCGYLSPATLAIILGYSLSKRFTFLCHVILGMGLGIAPLGAYLAVLPEFNWIPIILGLAVTFWVAGFDIIYALQDEEFDKNEGLNSIPSKFGQKKALWISRFFHLACAYFLSLFVHLFGLNPPLGVALVLFVGFLIFQHTQVKPYQLEKVNIAFFTANGMASVLFGALTIGAILYYG